MEAAITYHVKLEKADAEALQARAKAEQRTIHNLLRVIIKAALQAKCVK